MPAINDESPFLIKSDDESTMLFGQEVAMAGEKTKKYPRDDRRIDSKRENSINFPKYFQLP